MKKKHHPGLSAQVHMYSLETSCFYTPKEQMLHNRMTRYLRHKYTLKAADTSAWYTEKIEKYKSVQTFINQKIKTYKNQLTDVIRSNPSVVRTLTEDKLTDTRVISVFESALTRAAGIQTDERSTDIMVIQTYFYNIMEQLITNGYTYNKEAYIYFTSSAGQIRTKKTVFIRQSLWNRLEGTLMCGLTVSAINRRGGINANKFLAYLALSNTATQLWKDFDIGRCIVVPDFETSINCEADVINDKTYQVKRTAIDIPITHTDGCGMILPRLSKQNLMVRLPWIKGLLASFDFIRFIREQGASPVVRDIYGREWDILKDRIQIIFTESQFKMSQFYDSWDQYQTYFQKYGCQAGMCTREESYIPGASANYQMLQTLTDITDEEMDKLLTHSLDTLDKISTDKHTILRLFGAVPGNSDKTYLQQALELYPEMLQDEFCRARLREIKKSLVREFRSGKLEIDGKYTFIVPDLYAFCQHLFQRIPVPGGLLQNGQVFCRLYQEADKLDCLRSPHLYREHAVRENLVNDRLSSWFRTDALYTSSHDPISRILQFDVDGDKSLVVADRLLIEIAERNMANDSIVPLYYDMKKASPAPLSAAALYAGLSAAYRGGNIGYYSNSISKIFNFTDWSNISEEEKQEALHVIRLLCMENNFCIDMAKTLYMPERPKEVHALISRYTSGRLPHFFRYTKDKSDQQVEKNCGSFVDKLETKIRYTPIRLSVQNFGKFSYRKLMHNTKIVIDEDQVIQKYNTLNRNYHFRIRPGTSDNITYILKSVREELLDCPYEESDVCDMLVKYLYTKKTPHKELLWQCFGQTIVRNLKENIPSGSIQCKTCGHRFLPNSPSQKYCADCGGYRPVVTKVIQCVDCGCSVTVDAKDTGTCRCELHRLEHKRQLRREQNRRAYEKRKKIQHPAISVS